MSRISADASVFQAIADPTRRRILGLLAERNLTVTAMLEDLGREQALTQSAFSQHLAVLRRAGLTVARKTGRTQVYSIRPEPLREVSDWIAPFDAFWTDRLDRLGNYLDRQSKPKRGKGR